jgi:hypothetical protein
MRAGVIAERFRGDSGRPSGWPWRVGSGGSARVHRESRGPRVRRLVVVRVAFGAVLPLRPEFPVGVAAG